MTKPTGGGRAHDGSGARAEGNAPSGARGLGRTGRRGRPHAGERASNPATAAAAPGALGPVNALSGAAAVVASVAVMLIAAESRWTFTFADGLFWGGVGGFVVLRAIATRFTQSERQPATFQKWTRRALLIGLAAVALWVGAQSVQSRTARQDARPSLPPATQVA